MKHEQGFARAFASVLLLLFASAGAATALPYPDEVLSDSPFAYWRLGEASGPSAVSEVGSITGTYQGSITFSEPSLIATDVIDTAVSLDGASGWIDIPSDPLINTGGPYEAKTIELWFVADDLSNGSRIQMLYEQGGGSRGLNLYLFGNTLYMGGWNFPAADGPTTPWGASGVSTTVVAGTAYHAVLVFEYDSVSSTGSLTGYLNGVSIGVDPAVGRLFAASNAPGLGAIKNATYFLHSDSSSGSGPPREFFQGDLDEVALYNSALSSTRVLDHYTAATVPEPKTIALMGAGLGGLAAALSETLQALLRAARGFVPCLGIGSLWSTLSNVVDGGLIRRRPSAPDRCAPPGCHRRTGRRRGRAGRAAVR